MKLQFLKTTLITDSDDSSDGIGWGMGCDRAFYRNFRLSKLTLKHNTLLRQSSLLNTLSVTEEKLLSDFPLNFIMWLLLRQYGLKCLTYKGLTYRVKIWQSLLILNMYLNYLIIMLIKNTLY